MAKIKKYAFHQKLSDYAVFIEDTQPLSKYFEIRELPRQLTGGKNAFLVLGTEFLKLDSEIKIEALDAENNPLYVEPGRGIPQYYEGTAKVVAVYVYEDTPIGLGKITFLGEAKQYENDTGFLREIPPEWKDNYNVRWSTTVEINTRLSNETKVRFYKRPVLDVSEVTKSFYTREITYTTQSTGTITGYPLQPEADQNYRYSNVDTIYRLQLSGNTFSASMIDQEITMSDLPKFNSDGTYVTTVKDVLTENVALAQIPYYQTSSLDSSQTVKSFTGKSYFVEHPSNIKYKIGPITGSFAQLKLSRMNTFAGDVNRVRLYRQSQNSPSDFNLVTDQILESTEILRNSGSRDLQERTGYFYNQTYIDDYWSASVFSDAPSGSLTVTHDSTQLLDAVKLAGTSSENTGSTPRYKFITSEGFDFVENTEYTMTLHTIGIRPAEYEAKLEVYLTGSAFNNDDVGNPQGKLIDAFVVSASDRGHFRDIETNLIADYDGIGSLSFLSYYGDWYISNISLKAANETSFSPEETTIIVQSINTLVDEEFIYKAEFFDINNNYIPVNVFSVPTTFGGGTAASESQQGYPEVEIYEAFDGGSYVRGCWQQEGGAPGSSYFAISGSSNLGESITVRIEPWFEGSPADPDEYSNCVVPNSESGEWNWGDTFDDEVDAMRVTAQLYTSGSSCSGSVEAEDERWFGECEILAP